MPEVLKTLTTPLDVQMTGEPMAPLRGKTSKRLTRLLVVLKYPPLAHLMEGMLPPSMD